MPLNNLPLFQSFEEIGTNESMLMTSGTALSDTRQVSRFHVIQDTRPFTLDIEHNFTPKEISEIYRSLIDIDLGHYKSSHDTEELFADLDRK